MTNKKMDDGTEEKNWGDAKNMKLAGFEEIESCSGTGLNTCLFNFKKGGDCLQIATLGEYKKEFNSPKVHSWTMQPCGDTKSGIGH